MSCATPAVLHLPLRPCALQSFCQYNVSLVCQTGQNLLHVYFIQFNFFFFQTAKIMADILSVIKDSLHFTSQESLRARATCQPQMIT